MSESLNKAKQLVLNTLTGNPYDCGITTIYGGFGTGKTMLVNEIVKELHNNSTFDIITKFENYEKIFFLPDLTYEMIKKPVLFSLPGNVKYEETDYNRFRYYELINEIKQNASQLFGDVVNRTKIFSEHYNENREQFEDVTISFIEQHFEKKSDKRLLLNTARVISESFVVDLMNNLIPISENNLSELSRLECKRKALVIIEDINLTRINILEFVREHLIPVCCNTAFGNFTSYDISFLSKEVMPRDFIDFSFIITSRDEKAIKLFEDFSGKESLNIQLGLFNDEDIVDFINYSGIDSTEVYEQFRKVSRGVPAVLDLCLESHKLGQGLHELRMIYQSAAKRILKNLNDTQMDWLRCASFLEKFDADGLRCFPMVREYYQDAFNFITFSGEYSEKADTEGFYRIKPLIADILIEATRDSSKAMASSLTKIALHYRESLPFLKKFEIAERNFLRQLAYFDRFDLDFTFDKAFEKHKNSALQAFNKHKSLFIKNDHTYSLKPEIRSGFEALNQLLDFEKYDKKKKFALQIWKIFENKSLEAIKNAHETISKLKQEEQDIIREKKTKKQRYEELQSHFILLENEHISQLNRMLAFSNNHNIVGSVVFFFVCLLLILLGWGSPAFFNSIFTADESYGKTFQVIFYVASVVSGTFFFISIAKILKVYSQSKDMNALKDEIKATEAVILAQQEEMLRIKEFQEKSASRLEQIIKERAKMKDTIEKSNELLREPFINSQG